MADPDCLFCKIVAGEIPATTVHTDADTVAFMDVNPATRGHLLVVPREHVPDLHGASDAQLAAVMATARRMADRQRDRLGAAGVNVLQNSGAAAWQTVYHLHVHVVPRYDGDPLRLPWVPAPGDPDAIAAAGAELAA